MYTRIASWATAAPVVLVLALHRAFAFAFDHDRDDHGHGDHAGHGATGSDDRGQTTAEYALVLLGVAAIALAVVSWASRTNLVSKLLDVVFSTLFRKIT